jgi:quercetin dioxygenase-like cupin family protein
VIFVMKGRVRFDLNGDEGKTLGPGDVAMFDDVHGGGHKATALDGEGVMLAVAGMSV